jgi:hypothetical protein
VIEINDPLEDWQPPRADELAEIEREAGEEALGHLAGKVAEDAATTPGWKEFAEGVGVHAADGEQYVGLPPDDPDHEKYFDMEYGTEKTAPTGFLRNALTQHGPEAGRLYSGAMLHRVWNRRP